MVFRFDSAFPPELKKPVRAILDQHIAIVPDWCRVVTIYYSLGGNNGDLNCATFADYHYRFAQVYVYAGWVNSKEREHDLIHELFHIVTAAAHNTGKAELERLLTDKDSLHRQAVLETHKNAIESMTEDLTILYLSGRLSQPRRKKS